MSPIERIEAVLAGEKPDHPPVSFWHHFPPDQVHGPAAVEAHIRHLERFDLDFLKVMNDNGYPPVGPINAANDLRLIQPLRGDEDTFQRQLDLLADLKRRLSDRVYMPTTLFNAWGTLRHLIRPPKQHRPPNLDAAADQPSATIGRYLAEDAGTVRSALQTIAVNLARFAEKCLQAGADGIFLSVRDDWLRQIDPSGGLYQDLVRPCDVEILGAASPGRLNILHVCGRPADLEGFAAYPVHAIHWADRAAGPAIAAVRDPIAPAICGGVDNLRTLAEGTPDQCAAEVHDALAQAARRPMIVAPGCTYDPEAVPIENLEAVVGAARQHRYA